MFVRFVLLFAVALPSELKQKQGRGFFDRKLVQAYAPSNFIASRPKADLLFWFFGDFRCGVPLFIVTLLYINVKC